MKLPGAAGGLICVHQPGRDYASMAYDATTGDALLFGASVGNRNLADTWT